MTPLMSKHELALRLKACRSVAAMRQLQRSRFGDELDATWLDVLDDACMFGAASVLGMIQEGVPVQALQTEIVQLMADTLKGSAVMH